MIAFALIHYSREMENKCKLNALTISDEVRFVRLVEIGVRKKCKNANEFNIPPDT